jgi:drug/metabolite transporter (DMT)-like permease
MPIALGRGERWALLAAASYTVVNITLRAAAPEIDPVLGAFLRQVPVAVIAWLVVLRSGAVEFRPGHPAFLGRDLVWVLLASGAISLVVGNIAYQLALVTAGLGVSVSGIQAGSVLGGLVLSTISLREPPTRAQSLGAAVVLAGLAAIGVAQTSGLLPLWYVGLLLAVTAGSCYAAANALTRVVQKRRPLLFVTLAGASVGGLLPLALIVGGRELLEPGSVLGGLAPTTVGVVLAAGLANALALASLALAVRYTTVASTNVVSAAAIVFSFVGSVVIFGEVGSPPMIAGVGLVVIGLVVAQLRRPSEREALLTGAATER